MLCFLFYCDAWSCRSSCMGSMSVSSCRCLCASCSSSQFCMSCSLLMQVENARGDHMSPSHSQHTHMQHKQQYTHHSHNNHRIYIGYHVNFKDDHMTTGTTVKVREISCCCCRPTPPARRLFHLTCRGTTLSGDIQRSSMLFEVYRCVQLNRWSVVCGYVLYRGQRGHV